MNDDNVKQELIGEGVRWLFELGLVNSPAAQNTLMIVTHAASKHVRFVEFVIDQNSRKCLVYLKLGFWANLFRRQEVAGDVLAALSKHLPSFALRVVYDKAIFEKALKVAQRGV